jgi:membrane-bound ClpP family serine protease
VGIAAIAGVALEVFQRGRGLHPTILESVRTAPPDDLFMALVLLLACWLFLFLELLIPSYGLLTLLGVSSLVWGAHLMWSVAASCGVAYIALWSSLVPGLLILAVWLAKHLGITLREQRKTPQPDMRPDARHAGLRLGDRGVARTALHPSGEGEFRGHAVSVTTETAFVDAGEAIEVIAISGYATVVREVGKEEPDDDS